MTLFRQFSLVLLLLLLLALSGTLYLGTAGLRDVFSEQLESHSGDTATSLGMMLSTTASASDRSMMEAIINAAFDHGDFLAIELVDNEGKQVITRNRTPDTSGVPGWFVNYLSIATPTAEALVMSGWKQTGTIRVTGNPWPAYKNFWHATLNTLQAYIAATTVLLLLALLSARYLLLPLRNIRLQAEAICNHNYMVQKQLPRTQELRSAVVAMNRLSTKINDIFSEQAALTEALREQVFQDALTGVGNRRYFDRILPALVEDQEQVSSGALLLLELHQFARMNEVSGYTTGDDILRRSAQLIQSQLRLYDNCYIARISGATFAILAAGLTADGAESLAATLCQTLYQLRADGLVAGNDIAHIGIAMWHHGYRSGDVLSEADHALRTAQSSGQNTWQRHRARSANQPDIYGAERWRSHIQNVIDRGSVMLATQPVLDTRHETPVLMHHEVLARIPDPGGTGINAGYFLPMAERLGLASQLDKIAINMIIEHIKAESGNIQYAVNLSSTSLRDAVFIQWLCSNLSRAPTVARRMLFEFPEFAAISNLQNVRGLVERLNELGCRCGIDHFGRGFAPYGYLRSMQLHYLKVDSSHVRNLETDRDSQFFIKSLTDTAHSIDMLVFAQSVETRKQMETLTRTGLDGMQGYLLGKPVNLESSSTGNICQE